MTPVHVVVGSGPVGTHLAARLLADGETVRVVTRSGTPAPGPDGTTLDVEHLRADATDPDTLARATRGADVLHCCANPAYHRWPQTWPALTAATLAAAEAHDAVLVTAGNLYGYGPVTTPMTEDSPLVATEAKGRARADAWRTVSAHHAAGRVRATEVRAADYLGPLALDNAHAGSRLLAPLLAGRTVRPVGDPDATRTWTYLPDLAATMSAAARTEAAWGSAWHAPSPAPRSLRELTGSLATAAGAPPPRISPVPIGVVRAVGLLSPLMRELARVGHQHTGPFVMDSARTQDVLGLTPTPWSRIEAETLAWWRARTTAGALR